MHASYINPFIESVYDLFTTMLGAKVTRGEVSLAQSGLQPGHVVAIIGMSGTARGTVAVAFPPDTLFGMVERLIGERLTTLDETMLDSVSEIVNIIAGGAKARLSQSETPITLGLPTVVSGTDYTVSYPSDSKWIDVAFTSEFGPFSLRVTFEPKEA